MKRFLLAVAATAATTTLGACAVPVTPALPGPAPAPVRPVCTATTAHWEDGTTSDVVTFRATDPAPYPCDVTGDQQLDVVFDDSYDPAWGGDASVARAAAECDDMGGAQVWVQGPYRLVCANVDH